MKKILSLEIENNRIFGLDILRCLAIIFVFHTHNVSLISYSLYLVHYSLVKKLIIDIVLLPEIAELNVVLIYFIKNSVYWVASFAIAFFSYKYFEVPTTKLRNKF